MLDDPDAVGWVAVTGAVVAIAALFVAVGAQARLSRMRRALLVLRGHAGDHDLLHLLARQSAELAEQRHQFDVLRERLDETRQDVAASLRHVAVVRYDAQRPASSSAALLDDAGDGLVVTFVDGPGGPGTSVKALVGGASEPPLSAAETRAVQAATAASAPAPRGRQ